MAGYFIDLLSHAYPDAIVSYFLCKKGQDGLTRACDIIRTIAYQLAKRDKSIYDALDELKRSDAFQIDDKLGVAFLFKKLVSEPLNLNDQNREVYIIIDGVDEADFAVKDPFRKQAEMETLINCLVNLSSVRLLFISRPIDSLYRVQNMVKKLIEKNDNEDDIMAYVKQTLEASETLKEGFDREKIDPYKYFSEKADSIFLWVVIVLERLEKAETEGEFKKYLAGFTESSGDMELLYTAVLSSFTEKTRTWITQILKWITLAAGALTVELLKEAVETSVPDKLLNFKRFLDVQCGAILRLVPARWSEAQFTVQLIHETLRSYLIDPDLTCNVSFRIDEQSSHEEVASVCLRALCCGKDSELIGYAANSWQFHLSKVNVSRTKTLFINLYDFFNSEGCKLWLRIILRNYDGRDGRYVYAEEGSLQIAYQYLMRQGKLSVSTDEPEDSDPTTWATDILDSPWKLEEIVGKTAAELWLYDALPTESVIYAFWLSLKHYCKLNGRSMASVSDLQDLAHGEFSCIRAWVNESPFKDVQQLGLGIGYYELHLCEKALQHLNSSIEHLGNSDEFYREMVLTASIEANDIDQAIAVFNSGPTFRSPSKLVFALNGHGKWDEARKILDRQDGSVILWALYRLQIDLAELRFDEAVEDCEQQIKKSDSMYKQWWSWQCLAHVYKASGDANGVLRLYERAMESGQVKWGEGGLHNTRSDVALVAEPIGSLFLLPKFLFQANQMKSQHPQ